MTRPIKPVEPKKEWVDEVYEDVGPEHIDGVTINLFRLAPKDTADTTYQFSRFDYSQQYEPGLSAVFVRVRVNTDYDKQYKSYLRALEKYEQRLVDYTKYETMRLGQKLNAAKAEYERLKKEYGNIGKDV